MKKLFTIICLFFISLSTAQNLKVQLDYIVDYKVANSRKGVNDTISIGFSKDGKFLWTDQAKLAKSFVKEVFEKTNSSSENYKSNILIDTQTLMAYISIEFKKNHVFFAIDVNDFVPETDDPIDEQLNLESRKTENKIVLFGTNYHQYDVYPSSEPEDIVKMVFDQELEFDNNIAFKKFIALMLRKTGSTGNIQTNLPNGIILSIRDRENPILEAIRIDTNTKELNINNSFTIN